MQHQQIIPFCDVLASHALSSPTRRATGLTWRRRTVSAPDVDQRVRRRGRGGIGGRTWNVDATPAGPQDMNARDETAIGTSMHGHGCPHRVVLARNRGAVPSSAMP